MTKLDEFTRAYIETALWSSTDDEGDSLDCYGVEDVSAETLAVMVEDCKKFQRENAEALDPANCLRYGPDYGPMGRAGHDFWLTRIGHGAGFWDGDWEEEAGQKLTQAAESFGDFYLYVDSVDGKIHGERC